MAIEKRKRKIKRELRKSASYTRLIIDIFVIQTKKNELTNIDDLSLILTAISSLINLSKGGKNKKKSVSELHT